MSLQLSSVKLVEADLRPARNRGFFLHGSVRIPNAGLMKRVTVFYSDDNWGSVSQTEALYGYRDPTQVETEIWTFSAGEICPVGAAQLAVRLEVDGQIYWDNNGGGNYRLRPQL